MINIVKRIDEIQKIVDKYGDSMEPSSRNKYLKEIKDMREILDWIEYQCTHLYEGTYNSDSREMTFTMKNTTRFHFRVLSFALITYDGKKIRINVNDWRPRRAKKISFYHDFNNDWHFKTMNVIRFKNHAESVEFDLYDPRAAEKTGLEGGEQRRIVDGISKKQGYLVSIRSFIESVKEYDLRAKARELESVIIDIFDIMEEKPELTGRTRKFMVVYLPTVNRMMNDYQKASSRNVNGQDVGELRDRTHEAMNVAIVAFGKLKEELTRSDVEESEVDLDIMKSFMKEEGLIK